MFGSPILEVGIGLIFVFLVYGLVCTAVNEAIAQFLSLRAETLWGAIRSLLQDPHGAGLAKDLYNHPLIRGLAVKNADRGLTGKADPEDRSEPSYLSS